MQTTLHQAVVECEISGGYHLRLRGIARERTQAARRRTRAAAEKRLRDLVSEETITSGKP